jgi:hypothetical protein
MSKHVSRVDLAITLRPLVPKGDDREAASDVLITVVDGYLAWSEELRVIVNEHSDTAPASSEHVSELNGAITRAVLEWVERWPA